MMNYLLWRRIHDDHQRGKRHNHQQLDQEQLNHIVRGENLLALAAVEYLRSLE